MIRARYHGAMIKNMAVIAHDNLKNNMVLWAQNHKEKLKGLNLFATGTTGSRIEAEVGLKVTKYKSGPLGGDQQIGGAVAEGKIDAVIFFWDPLAPHPHDVDVKALLRIAAVYNIPMACNQATADMIMLSL